MKQDDNVPTFGRNEMPAELAAQLLERYTADEVAPGDELTPERLEVLAVLAEECGETVQRVTKILRFGLRVNPWTKRHNRTALEMELGDIVAATAILESQGVVSLCRIIAFADAKLAAFRAKDGRLQHASADGVDALDMITEAVGPWCTQTAGSSTSWSN